MTMTMTVIMCIAGSVFGFLLGAVVIAILGYFVMGRDMFNLSERFNSLYSQNSTILSNMSNPAVTGLMNAVTMEENKKGFDAGLNFAFLSLYKICEGGMLVGDFDDVSEQLRTSIGTLLEKPDLREKTHEDLMQYYKSQEEDDDDNKIT